MGIPPSVHRDPKDQVTAGCLLHGGHCHKLNEFPESLQWESLIDVLRGHAKSTTTATKQLSSIVWSEYGLSHNVVF